MLTVFMNLKWKRAEEESVWQRSGVLRCSVMTVRRFYMEHNLQRRNHVSDTAVISSIYRVIYDGMPSSIGVRARESRVGIPRFETTYVQWSPMGCDHGKEFCLSLYIKPQQASLRSVCIFQGRGVPADLAAGGSPAKTPEELLSRASAVADRSSLSREETFGLEDSSRAEEEPDVSVILDSVVKYDHNVFSEALFCLHVWKVIKQVHSSLRFDIKCYSHCITLIILEYISDILYYCTYSNEL
ncbi:uncharacterized protein LOC121896815 [Thunnus maccoyii]|uniref:uncharacterized protein LOC121896815 n=1 Tax=Thunnus maccoyii TaxID=8240 RepID=UPI001C4B1F13|nr:uncharacterized protein LOC121896815 [Thunnus maccoyii]